MIRYSVIIPQRDRADELRLQLPAVSAALTQLDEPYEIVVVDDGSAPAALRLLEKLLGQCHSLRVLRLDRPGGTSVALSAGIEAARGEIIVALEAGPSYPAEQISWLVEWLDRADLVLGRRRRQGLAKFWQRIVRVPRWLLLGLESHDPDCLFWAAPGGLADLSIEAGMARYLPAFLARRGFRVCETYVEHLGPLRRWDDVGPNPADLLAAWWRCRRWRESSAYELTPTMSSAPALRIVGSEQTSASAVPSNSVQQQAKSA